MIKTGHLLFHFTTRILCNSRYFEQIAKYFKNAEIEAFDLFKHYIKLLDEKITENALEDRVFSGVGDMKDPDFANEEFDIIFCEASVEIMGFKKALGE